MFYAETKSFPTPLRQMGPSRPNTTTRVDHVQTKLQVESVYVKF
jgi:hypothetical protein